MEPEPKANARRGRPRLISEGIERFLWRDGNPETRHLTARSIQNRHYELLAFQALGFTSKPDGFPAEYRWLCDPDRQVAGKHDPTAYRRTVLAELGRFPTEDLIRRAAAAICELAPATSGAAVAQLRRWRLGDEPGRPKRSLTARVVTVLRDHRHRYPAATAADLWDALTAAYDEVMPDSA